MPLRMYPDTRTLDEEFEYLRESGYTGALNDMMFNALGDLGYSSLSLPERLFNFGGEDLFLNVAGYVSGYGLDFTNGRYYVDTESKDFSDAVTFSRASTATMVDSDGVLKWAPHNLLTYSEDFTQWAVGADLSIEASTIAAPNNEMTALKVTKTGASSVSVITGGVINNPSQTKKIWARTVSGTGTIALMGYHGLSKYQVTLTDEWQLFEAPADYSEIGGPNFYAVDFRFGNLTEVLIWGAHLYRSDLGGMVDNPATGNSYVPTTSSAVYLPRIGHHVWNGAEWVNEGLLLESEARTNLLLNSATLSTQNVTVTATAHTLHFTGTGTVTLSGASTDGPLVGIGTGEKNRVVLTFTPTAGTLTLTVSGTVSNAQLEAGSTPSSYTPTSGSQATRAAETLVAPSANLPWSPDAVSLQMKGRMTYADEDSAPEVGFSQWLTSSVDYIRQSLSTVAARTGSVEFAQRDPVSGLDSVAKLTGQYSPGILVPFNIASRHGSTFINGAVDGTALIENGTPTALPDLPSTDLEIGDNFMGTISEFRLWAADLGDAGIEEASDG